MAHEVMEQPQHHRRHEQDRGISVGI